MPQRDIRDDRNETSYPAAGNQRGRGSVYDHRSETGRTEEFRPERRHPSAGRPRRTEQSPRDRRRRIADETLQIITTGNLILPSGVQCPIFHDCVALSQATKFYADDSDILKHWEEPTDAAFEESVALMPTDFGIYNCTTLAAAQKLCAAHPSTADLIGVLNFASATKPGGGFLSGAEAQEESIARSSSLFTSLTSPAALPFYSLHSSRDTNGFYTHSMIYSPDVLVFRDDTGQIIAPYTVDVVTSPAVNAGVVRQRIKSQETERLIELSMRERMARILYLFQRKGCKNLVLGSFGTGVFQNNITMVASIWAELLALPTSKFRAVFETVEFAVLGQETYEIFRTAFEAKRQGLQVPGR